MAAALVAIADYGSGNRRSVQTALERVGAEAVVTRDPELLAQAAGLVIPGVGAFPAAMEALQRHGLADVIIDFAEGGRPVLGACLGMQLLFDESEEQGGAQGLGLLPGVVRRVDCGGLKLPHIGWCEVTWEGASPISHGLPDPAFFYHVHSYAPVPADGDEVLGRSNYGGSFVSVAGRDNVFGVQFHPEKSSRNGLAMLANFVSLCRGAAG